MISSKFGVKVCALGRDGVSVRLIGASQLELEEACCLKRATEQIEMTAFDQPAQESFSTIKQFAVMGRNKKCFLSSLSLPVNTHSVFCVEKVKGGSPPAPDLQGIPAHFITLSEQMKCFASRVDALFRDVAAYRMRHLRVRAFVSS